MLKGLDSCSRREVTGFRSGVETLSFGSRSVTAGGARTFLFAATTERQHNSNLLPSSRATHCCGQECPRSATPAVTDGLLRRCNLFTGRLVFSWCNGTVAGRVNLAG